MIHLILKLLLFGVVAIGVVILLIHIFPMIVAILAILGLIKIYQVLRRPKPPGFWR